MLKHFFSYDFQFYINRIRLEPADQIFGLIAAGLVVIAIFFYVLSRFRKDRVSKRVARRFANIFATIGIVEVLWYGARYQNVNFFGTHFVFLLILLVGVIWTLPTLWYLLRKYGAEKAAWEKEQVKQRYLNYE